ncbi:MAG TPA: hypothetical protein VFH24_02085 [Gemmatimonadales bacterium]|nr:hypothetical protein [Gemmatimonadales bacterium]
MHWLIVALAWLGLMVIPSTLRAQAAGDTSAISLRRLVAELSPSARLRLISSGQRWSGRLEARQADSLTVASTSGRLTIPLNAVDTLWLRRESHTGLAAGAGFGAVMFALLQLGHGGDRYTATRLGAIIFVGAAGAGWLIDRTSDRWSRRYPP